MVNPVLNIGLKKVFQYFFNYFPVISSVQKNKNQALLFVSFCVAVVVKIRTIYWASIAGQNFFVII